MNTSEDCRGKEILLIEGTNRPLSLTSIVAGYYAMFLEEKGIKVDRLSLDKLSPNFIGRALYHNQGKDPLFNALADKIAKAKKMVFIVPQYNGSFPGILKAFIDGLRVGAMDQGEVFRHKKCALLGVSRGYQGNILGLSHLEDILSYLGMHVMAKKVYLSGIREPSLGAFMANDSYPRQLQEQAEMFVSF